MTFNPLFFRAGILMLAFIETIRRK